MLYAIFLMLYIYLYAIFSHLIWFSGCSSVCDMLGYIIPSFYSNGDVAFLNCTAIVNTSNETLTDKNPVSDSIHRYAGPELRDELLKLKGRGRYLASRWKTVTCHASKFDPTMILILLSAVCYAVLGQILSHHFVGV